MSEVIPAVLPESLDELSDTLADFARFAPRAHIDVCDGAFVENLSWPLKPEDAPNFERLLSEEEGLAGWQRLEYEVHLMIERPEEQIAKWMRIGASRIVVHAEAVTDLAAIVREMGGLGELGVALKFETSLAKADEFVKSGAFLQMMTIREIGVQGSPFEEGAFARVQEAHARFPNVPISVDGGVTAERAKRLAEAGAERFVVGSAIIESDNPARAYREILNTITEHADQ